LSTAEKKKAILVYGGGGQLGSDIVTTFSAEGWHTICVDPVSCSGCDTHISLTKQDRSLKMLHVIDTVKTLDCDLHAIVNVAGGWQGGDAASSNVLATADAMYDMNVRSALAAAHLAALCLSPGGLLALTGAAPALQGTPSMLGYGTSKAAVHHIVKSVSEDPSMVERDARVIAVLPVTIDTPMNRKFMPDADHSSWTPPSEFSGALLRWATGQEKPEQGGLYVFNTENDVTSIELA
jgi:dihydropteridine reductase